jgi:cytochrome c553
LETRSHLRWAIRIIPLRKDNAGKDVDVKTILEAFENGDLARLQESIAAKDGAAFDKVYRSTLVACYACHKASDKPFIRPQIPTEPEATIINFDPSAKWPQ